MRDHKECKYYKDGKCEKYGDKRKCSPSDASWFSDDFDELEHIDINEVCEQQSIFGNSFFNLSGEELEALANGKVLHANGEYGTFIASELSNPPLTPRQIRDLDNQPVWITMEDNQGNRSEGWGLIDVHDIFNPAVTFPGGLRLNLYHIMNDRHGKVYRYKKEENHEHNEERSD